MLNSGFLDAETSQMMSLTASGLNVSNWNDPNAIGNLTISTMAAYPDFSTLSTSLGISATSLLNQLYSFGPSPSNSTLGNYAITLLEASYSDISSSDVGFSISDLMQSTYQLGLSPNSTATWDLACSLISNATQSTFAQSPLFTINSTSLQNLLMMLASDSTTAEINQAIDNEITNSTICKLSLYCNQCVDGQFC